MFLRILKKDLKRRRTTNIIMVLFVILATMFVSSGSSNVITVANGTDFYLDQADVGDYIIITRDSERNCLDHMLETTEAINSYATEDILYASSGNIFDPDDNELEASNMLLFQSFENSGMKLASLLINSCIKVSWLEKLMLKKLRIKICYFVNSF